MRFWVKDDQGNRLDALIELESNAIIVHSRGGSSGAANSRNQDYQKALRLILHRLSKFGRSITGAWVDSSRVQMLPLADRSIWTSEDAGVDADELYIRFGRRMERVGQSTGSRPNGGNRSKRLRIEVTTGSLGELASVIGVKADSSVPRSALRLPASELRKVTEAEIWSAVEVLEEGSAAHGFGEVVDFRLVTPNGMLVPTKAVFGLAATTALGFPVHPSNFSGGEESLCLRILKEAGWELVKDGARRHDDVQSLSHEDNEWAEGNQRRISHLRRERHRGAAKAKRAAMLAQHGRLFCEECHLDPIQHFGGPDGEACIEVHHRETELADMQPGHRTRLEHLECLCANCHRVRHRRMKAIHPKV